MPCRFSASIPIAEQNLAGGAVAALKSVMLDKSGLQRVQIVAFGRPSMVVTDSPSCITARVRQELMRRPSINTVQAPH